MKSKCIAILFAIIVQFPSLAIPPSFSEVVARQICELSIKCNKCIIKTSPEAVSSSRSSLITHAGVRQLDYDETVELDSGGLYSFRQEIIGRPTVEIVVTNFVGLSDFAKDISPLFCRTGTIVFLRATFPAHCCVDMRSVSQGSMCFSLNGDGQLYDYGTRVLSNYGWPIEFRAQSSDEKRLKLCSRLADSDYRAYQRELDVFCKSKVFASERALAVHGTTNTVSYGMGDSECKKRRHWSKQQAQFVVWDEGVVVSSIATCSHAGIMMVAQKEFKGFPLVILHLQTDGMWQCSFYTADGICEAAVFHDRILDKELFLRWKEFPKWDFIEEDCRLAAKQLVFDALKLFPEL